MKLSLNQQLPREGHETTAGRALIPGGGETESSRVSVIHAEELSKRELHFTFITLNSPQI